MPWGPNLITGDSSTFEGGTGDWAQIQPFDVFESSPLQAHSGSRSLRLLDGPPVTPRATIELTGPDLIIDKTYRVSIWLKNAVGKINLEFYDAGGEPATPWINMTAPTWTQFSTQLTCVTPGPCVIKLINTDPPSVTSQFVDDVALQKLITERPQYLPLLGVG